MITFAKLNTGDWGLRGTGLVTGEQVRVSRRDGSASTLTVGRIVWTNGSISLAMIDRDAPKLASSTSDTLTEIHSEPAQLLPSEDRIARWLRDAFVVLASWAPQVCPTVNGQEMPF